MQHELREEDRLDIKDAGSSTSQFLDYYTFVLCLIAHLKNIYVVMLKFISFNK